MKKAKFLLSGWMGEHEREFSGETWAEVVDAFEGYQDLGCLARQAHMLGTTEDAESVDKMMEIVRKCWNSTVKREELAGFACRLTIGGFRCVSIEDEEGTLDFSQPNCTKKPTRAKTRKQPAKKKTSSKSASKKYKS